MIKKLLSLFGVVVLALAFTACEKKGPLEKAGEKADDAIKEAAEDIEEAAEDVEEAVEDGKEKVEEAVDDSDAG